MTYVGAILDRVDGDLVVVHARCCRIYTSELLAARRVDGTVVAVYFRLARAVAAVPPVKVAFRLVVFDVAVAITNVVHLQRICGWTNENVESRGDWKI